MSHSPTICWGFPGGELKLLVGGMLQLGMKLGMFEHGEEEE